MQGILQICCCIAAMLEPHETCAGPMHAQEGSLLFTSLKAAWWQACRVLQAQLVRLQAAR